MFLCCKLQILGRSATDAALFRARARETEKQSKGKRGGVLVRRHSFANFIPIKGLCFFLLGVGGSKRAPQAAA